MSTTNHTKKIYSILIAIMLIVIAIILIFLTNNNTSKIIINNEESKQLINTNALTMMFEIESGSGEYQIYTDNTWPQNGYTFNERLSGCENGSDLSWDDENKRVIVSTSVSDKCYVYFDVYVEPTLADVCSGGEVLSSCIQTYYTSCGEGVGDLYLHDGIGSYTNANQEAGDNSYRYSGANPNNYVCFGATGTDCQNEENLYRIIGVFNGQVKLIKATSYGDYAWDTDDNGNYSNTWNATIKPDIYTLLNETYYNTLGTEWQSLIAEATWQVGGINSVDTAKTLYNNEVGINQSGYEETMKIGLMYASDYGYGVNPEKWILSLFTSDYGTDNWLYIEDSEWLITRASNANEIDTRTVFYLESYFGGRMYAGYMGTNRVVRPTFYLKSNVTYISGSGTQSDPFRIV